ncbi:Conserved_hypothetical protein [Hexamita inflata]|uniref:Uncharacterized protein n=1 Tax=Hexamita inflata TaxID=28002 RepID=A0ABP1K287_9EUKA
MKPQNLNKSLCLITDKTTFTDNDIRNSNNFKIQDIIIAQIDKIPIHATSLIIVNNYLCSTLGINLHVNLTYLDLRNNRLLKVDLQYLVNLEYLDLSANNLNELDSISGNIKIKTLKVASNNLMKADFIATLSQLKELNIEKNFIYDLKSLYSHCNFSSSWVSIQKVFRTNSKPEKLINMVERYKDKIKLQDGNVILNINNEPELTDLVFLDQMNVTNVFISECHNISFTQVPKLLKYLWICNSDIQNLVGIEKITQLEHLTLRQCSLSRIQNQLEAVKKLPNLKYLDVAQNDITSAECICNEKLTSLNVSENNLKSLEDLRFMYKLKALDVSGNQLSSISILADLTDLIELNISFNAITSIYNLYRLTKLIYLNAIYNKIIDIEVCIKLKSLIDLRINGNIVQNRYVLIEYPNLFESMQQEQLIADSNDLEIQILREKSKNCNMLEKYKDQVKNKSLIINNDQFIVSLKFSDFLEVKNELSISKCNNISFEVVPVLVTSLKVNSCSLLNILGLEQILQITSLELSDNMLEDVIEIQELTKLTRLVLNNNKISRLSWVNALTQLKYLDLQNNKFISVECLKQVQSLIELYIQGNMVQDTEYLRLLHNYNENWNSPQRDFSSTDVEYYLGPNRTQLMVNECITRLKNAKIYLNVAFTYKNNVIGSKLIIKNDNGVIDLLFVTFIPSLIQSSIDSVYVDNCSVVFCNIQLAIQSLTITNCNLSNLSNLTLTSLIHLDLGFNNLMDVSALGGLSNLKKLILRDNNIYRLECLKLLFNLVHLDVRNNRLLYVSFIQQLPQLSELFIEGNIICNLKCVVEHPRCNNFITFQKDPILSDVQNYGQCTKQEIDNEFKSIFLQIEQRNSLPQYQNIVKMIAKYKQQIQSLTWITLLKQQIQGKELDKIINMENCVCDSSGINWRLTCQKDLDTVLQKIQEIDPQLKTNIEEFCQLQIIDDVEIYNLSFINQFKVQKLVVEQCENIKFNCVANTKVLHANNCKLNNINGIQNWCQLLELSLCENQLNNITQINNLTNITDLALNQNQITDLQPLKKLTNLTDLQLDSNKISNIDSLKEHINLMELYLSKNLLRNIQALQGLVNLRTLDISSNIIENIDSLKDLRNLQKLYLQQNKIKNINSLKELVNLIHTYVQLYKKIKFKIQIHQKTLQIFQSQYQGKIKYKVWIL